LPARQSHSGGFLFLHQIFAVFTHPVEKSSPSTNIPGKDINRFLNILSSLQKLFLALFSNPPKAPSILQQPRIWQATPDSRKPLVRTPQEGHIFCPAFLTSRKFFSGARDLPSQAICRSPRQ